VSAAILPWQVEFEAAARATLAALTPERLWRCEACGKWSHAKHRPSSHRVVTNEWREWIAQFGEDNPGSNIGMGGEPEQFRACGPFAEWWAIPAEVSR
jgi:hypothetical protein